MSDIVPFDECIARPDMDGKKNWLIDHLLGVKDAIEKRLANGSSLFKGDSMAILLASLAGICHDIAKAHMEWQHYIKGKRKQGPNHAPAGAFLFSYLGYHLLKLKSQWPQYAVTWLWLIRDLADHHGSFKCLAEEGWIGTGEWSRMDLPGITGFIGECYPELSVLPITEEALRGWTEALYDINREALDKLEPGHSSTLELMKDLTLWRELTTALVAGDRFHITPTKMTGLNRDDHIRYDRFIDDFCLDNGDQSMAETRNQAQRQILSQLEKDPCRRVYTLEMPTGYGKTLTALKIANWMGREQGYEKITYVAPYLSILEQTSGVMETVLNTTVLEHHSLAVLEEKTVESHEEEGMLNSGQLMMESWANPIVCTSFQQWSKLLFPGRAQDTLRRAYLHNSVVIIDEPQIFAAESWNLFLCGLQSVAELYNLRVLFLSATMPPFDYGLSEQPACLAVKPVKQIERYQIEQKGEMDEHQVADYLVGKLPDKKDLSQAAILNTIADAYLVYKQLASKIDLANLKLLHGMMAPLHKRVEIEKIKRFPKENKNKRLYVVSTQIIEAGVDLSFDHILRALSILPSIIQAAGRVNRNFARDVGLLTLVLFLRQGKQNTRGAIYPSILQKLTDQLLKQKNVWMESEVLELIKEYYKRMFAHNSYETGKQAIADAYEGNWPALAQFKAFGEDYPRLPVFIPWQANEEDKKYFPQRLVALQRRMHLYTPESIYECYEDRDYYTSMSFQTRKEFMILMNHYVVNVPDRLAISIAGSEEYRNSRIPCLLNESDYDPVAGLAKRSFEGFDQFI